MSLLDSIVVQDSRAIAIVGEYTEMHIGMGGNGFKCDTLLTIVRIFLWKMFYRHCYGPQKWVQGNILFS